MVLERERVGQGATGRGAGLLLPGPGPTFRDMAAMHGLRAARQAFEAWRRGALDAAALIRRLKLQCGLDARDALMIAGHDDEKWLRREYEARAEAGFPASWLSRKQVGALAALDAAAGMRVRDGFVIDPYRACLGLASAAIRRRATFFERTHVSKVRFTRKDVELLAAGGTIRAAKVIVATGAATQEFRSLRRHFKERDRYLTMTEPLPPAMRKQLGRPDMIISDLRMPRRRVRWTADHRILISGGDQETTD